MLLLQTEEAKDFRHALGLYSFQGLLQAKPQISAEDQDAIIKAYKIFMSYLEKPVPTTSE
jgi:hypothetical protein